MLHLSCLPSKYGIGNLGSTAHVFLEFLAEAGFSHWQVCPVGPTGFGDSPYQTYSSVAGNPNFIDWEPLVAANLVTDENLTPLRALPSETVDYDSLRTLLRPLIQLISQRFAQNPNCLESLYGDFTDFTEANSSWLTPYALYQALKDAHCDEPWWKWPSEDRSFPRASQRTDDPTLSDSINAQRVMQYIFFGQWKHLRERAQSLGLNILGDLPIYAAPDGAEVWSRPDLFQLDDKTSLPTHISGVPPDYFAPQGQLWGNPLYDWDALKMEGFQWWLDRLASQVELFDVVRIDHFRAFHDYWSVPSTENDARLGHWEQGPGPEFFSAVRKRFPDMPFLAEDLGLLNAGVHRLRRETGLPGMAVLQFAFDGDPDNLYLPHNLSPETVLYLGTHDNDTVRGWYESAGEEVRDNLRRYLNVSGDDVAWDLLRSAYRSVARVAVVTAQDLLSLGPDARFNVPGTPSGNWRWRLTESQFKHLQGETVAHLREQAEISGRLASSTGN